MSFSFGHSRMIAHRFLFACGAAARNSPGASFTTTPHRTPPSLMQISPRPLGGGYLHGGQGGIPRLRAGQVAGKTCHRHVFLHHSPSNPPQVFQKKNSPLTGAVLLLADRVGFEPTVPLLVHLISSQGRYNHFDTCP